MAKSATNLISRREGLTAAALFRIYTGFPFDRRRSVFSRSEPRHRKGTKKTERTTFRSCIFPFAAAIRPAPGSGAVFQGHASRTPGSDFKSRESGSGFPVSNFGTPNSRLSLGLRTRVPNFGPQPRISNFESPNSNLKPPEAGFKPSKSGPCHQEFDFRPPKSVFCRQKFVSDDGNLFLLPGIGLSLVYGMWLIHAVWSIFQTTDRTVRIIYAVLAIVLAIAQVLRLAGGI